MRNDLKTMQSRLCCHSNLGTLTCRQTEITVRLTNLSKDSDPGPVHKGQLHQEPETHRVHFNLLIPQKPFPRLHTDQGRGLRTPGL